MTLSNAKIYLGLAATATPSGTNVSGSPTIGHPPASTAIAGADIIYSFKIVSTAESDEVSLTASSGVVSATTGSPTITDGDGKDFEGNTLPALSTDGHILIEAGSQNGDPIAISETAGNDFTIKIDPGRVLVAPLSSAHVLKFWLDGSGDSFEAVILGKSAA